MAFHKKLLGLAIEKQCENMIALTPKTYSCLIGDLLDSVNINTTATKCKGYTETGNLYFKDYFDVFTEKKTIQGTNNNLQMAVWPAKLTRSTTSTT
jgi:hypothetical protein